MQAYPLVVFFCLLLAIPATLPADSPNQPKARLSLEAVSAEFDALKEDDVAWRKIAWKTCLLDGLEASRREKKPVLLWIFIDRPIDDERC